MLRNWIVLLCLSSQVAMQAVPCEAQVLRLTGEEPRGATKPAAEEKEPPPKQLRFDPAAEASPAFRYQFWVPPIRREPGNAVSHVLRAYVMVQDIPNIQQVQRDWSEKEIEDLPLSKFPAADAKAYLEKFRNVLDELAKAEQAERIDYDFRINELRGTAIFSTLLPELQHARDLGRLLAVEVRLAVFERRYEDAIRSLRTGFRLAEIVSAMGKSFIVGKLVAIAINSIMLQEVETMMQQPGAPNLYWALASLPQEIGDMRDALEGERFAFENSLYHVMQLPSEPMSQAAWEERIVATVSDVMQMQDGSARVDSDRSMSRFIAGAIVLVHGDKARETLSSSGVDRQVVDAMSYSEAVVRATRESLLVLQSAFYKWSLVPRSEADINQLAEKYLKDQMAHNRIEPAVMIGGLLLPAIQAAQAAGDRLLTKRNQLITVEAIRDYAATHAGKLPESLDKLEALPAWKQAGTNKPFEYKRISDSEAVLSRAAYWPGSYDRDAELRLIVTPTDKH